MRGTALKKCYLCPCTPVSYVSGLYRSTKTDNVVTYVTYLNVDNVDLSLRPGMTAAATIIATERNDVLLVPNTALRFTPAQVDRPATPASGGSFFSKIMRRMPPSSPRKSTDPSAAAAGMRQVWVFKKAKPWPFS